MEAGYHRRHVNRLDECGGVPPEKFREVLDSPEEMEQRIFAHAPRQKIEQFYRDGYEQMAELIVEYFRTA